MGKRDSAPTYGWVFMSALNRYIATIAIVILFIVAALLAGVYLQLKSDCSKPLHKDIVVYTYVIHLSIGREGAACGTV